MGVSAVAFGSSDPPQILFRAFYSLMGVSRVEPREHGYGDGAHDLSTPLWEFLRGKQWRWNGTADNSRFLLPYGSFLLYLVPHQL